MAHGEPQAECRDHGAEELCKPVGSRERGVDPPCCKERERDRRVEVAARDVAEVRDHDPDGETVRERNGDDVLAAVDARSTSDEDERERADELGNATAQDVMLH